MAAKNAGDMSGETGIKAGMKTGVKAAVAGPVEHWIRWASAAREPAAVGDFFYTVMPFVSTRLNMMDEGINWTPLGALRVGK